jgi:DNA-binding MarR family transcriptional regulator
MVHRPASAGDEAAEYIERLGRLLASRAHAAGLNPSQWEALRFLARANRFSRTPSGLALYLGATKGTVSQTVAALRRKGLVEGAPDAADKRSVTLRLSAAGRAAMARDPLAEFALGAESLGSKRAEELRVVLAQLLGTLQRSNGLRAFGLCGACRHFGRGEAADPKRATHRCRLLRVDLAEPEATQICSEQEAA